MDPDQVRAALAAGQKASAKAAGAGHNIATSAGERLDVVQGKLNEIRAAALSGDPEAAQEYMALTTEAGTLRRLTGEQES